MSQRKRPAVPAHAPQGNSANAKAPPRRPRRPPREAAAPLTVLNPHAAGIDVHSDMHMVCVPADRVVPQGQDTAAGLPASVRRFGAYSCDLHAIAAWPAECERTIGVTSFFPSLTVQPFAPRSGPGTSSRSNLPRPLSGQEFRDREDKKHCWEGPWEALPLWCPGRRSG